MQKAISVVIPNYNGVELFKETLPTVINCLKISGLRHEIIVADDCSTDGSLEFLQEHYPFITLVPAPVNSGFSVTANRGIHAARYDLVLLLNSDVKLEPGYFDHQLAYFDRPETFGVMGRIVGWDDEEIQDGAKYPSFHHAKIKTSVNYLLEEERAMEAGLYSMYVSGANALLDRKKFMQLGGFNELFAPFYVEDYELSLRAWRSGFTCYYDHRSICRHRTSTSIRSKSRKHYVKMIYNRNKWFLHAIHLDAGKRFLWMVQLVPEILGQTLLLKSYYIRALGLFLKNYGAVKRSRRQLRQGLSGPSLRSVNEVAEIIQESVKGKKVKFF